MVPCLHITCAKIKSHLDKTCDPFYYIIVMLAVNILFIPTLLIMLG